MEQLKNDVLKVIKLHVEFQTCLLYTSDAADDLYTV